METLRKKCISFFSYWYFRYTLVTELYMVENWERCFINILLISLFSILSLFNFKVLLPITSFLFLEN